jgi:hypothetical protein
MTTWHAVRVPEVSETEEGVEVGSLVSIASIGSRMLSWFGIGRGSQVTQRSRRKVDVLLLDFRVETYGVPHVYARCYVVNFYSRPIEIVWGELRRLSGPTSHQLERIPLNTDLKVRGKSWELVTFDRPLYPGELDQFGSPLDGHWDTSNARASLRWRGKWTRERTEHIDC